MNDPLRYTQAELRADAMASLCNRTRYVCQSSRTKAGQRAELTPRERLQAVAYAKDQCGLSVAALRRGFDFKYGVTHDAG